MHAIIITACNSCSVFFATFIDPRVILQSTQLNVNEDDLHVEICAVLENVMGSTSFPIEVTFSLIEDSAGNVFFDYHEGVQVLLVYTEKANCFTSQL